MTRARREGVLLGGSVSTLMIALAIALIVKPTYKTSAAASSSQPVVPTVLKAAATR